MSAVCLTSYTVSVLALVGSSVIVSQLPALVTGLVTTSPVPTPLPFVTPPTFLTDNDTTLIVMNFSMTDVCNDWFESFNEIENNSGLDVNSFYVSRRKEWLEQKNWLTSITRLVHVAAADRAPGYVLLY